MINAVGIPTVELPLRLVEQGRVVDRTHRRGQDEEVRFFYRHRPAVIPAIHQGEIILARWGCTRNESRFLPCTGWTKKATVESGWWAQAKAELVSVPAYSGYDAGVWFHVRQGFQAILIHDEQGQPHVYLIVEPATHYYNVMTRSEWMATLVEQRI